MKIQEFTETVENFVDKAKAAGLSLQEIIDELEDIKSSLEDEQSTNEEEDEEEEKEEKEEKDSG